MRATALLRKVFKPKISQNLVDEFGAPRPAQKAWAGQNKNKYFHDKYAHVHAKQKKSRTQLRAERKEQRMKEPPKPSFHHKFLEHQKKNPNLEYVFGKSAVLAAIYNRKVHQVFSGHPRDGTSQNIIYQCHQREIPIKVNVLATQLKLMCQSDVHNKYVAEVEKRPHVEFEDFEHTEGTLRVGKQTISLHKKNALGVFIDQITDTHNLGAILRSAYFLGADFAVISERNCAPLSPQVVKSSSGASEYLPIFYATHPLRLFEKLNPDWNIVATLADKKFLKTIELAELPQLLDDKPSILALGSEGDGLRMSLIQRSSHNVIIPPAHDNYVVDSLNVSVACAVLLDRFRRS